MVSARKIYAKKIIGGNVVSKYFSVKSWELMGANKQGWEKVGDESIPIIPVSPKIKEFLGEKKTPDVPVVAEPAPEPEPAPVVEPTPLVGEQPTEMFKPERKPKRAKK